VDNSVLVPGWELADGEILIPRENSSVKANHLCRYDPSGTCLLSTSSPRTSPGSSR
jgi:hypothetical protein